MRVSKPLVVFHCLAALVLALPGAWLLLAPHSLAPFVHGSAQTPLIVPLPGRAAGLGLLLAAAVNLIALAGGVTRAPLHATVLVYLIGLGVLHGMPSGAALWLWVPVVLYALPLAPWHRLIPDKRRAGEVKWFNPNKGFGFIVADNGDEIFVHFKAVRNGGRRSLRTGSRVRFTTRQSERGEQADQVFVLD